jgi:serine/threonine protein kinase
VLLAGYAADWWSAGIVLFELLTGIPPFTASRPEKIFDNILNGKMPWPDVPGEMSYEAQDLINRLLVHEPEKRLGANGAAEVTSIFPLLFIKAAQLRNKCLLDAVVVVITKIFSNIAGLIFR